MANTSQIRKIYALMTPRHRQNKESLILGITNDRTASISDLKQSEINDLIRHLESEKKPDPADTMRKKIISMAWQMNWTKEVKGKLKADIARINKWCIDSSYLKKGLNDYKYKELPKLVAQFEMVYKDYLNKIN